MRQGIRFFTRPGTFFSQMQFSRHHWVILAAFLGIVTLETQVGRHHVYYGIYTDYVSNALGLNWSAAAWIVMAARMVFMLVGSFALASFIWVVGNLFGRKTSKRVLFRRLAVVFTVLIGGYTLNHLTGDTGAAGLLAVGLYFWGLVLGYHALREQFALNHLETAVLGLFALLLVVSSWHFSNHVLETAARSQGVQELTKRPLAPGPTHQFRVE